MRYLIIFITTFLFAFEGIKIYNLPNIANEENTTEINTTENFTSTIKSIKPKLNIAVIIDKNRFKKYLPSIINSLNSYLLYKDVEYNLDIYDTTEINDALEHKNIIYYTFNPNDVYSMQDYNNSFYFPMINKNEVDINNSNFFFGGMDYSIQLKKLSSLIEKESVIAINDNTLTSKKLFELENKLFMAIPYKYNNINYQDLNNSYIFINTTPKHTIQILSKIYSNDINPNLILSTQINYSPLIIALTQNEILNKFIVANSILNLPKELIDIHMLLNSDIKFNYVNYAANILCNHIYNKVTNLDSYYMSDFLTYIFDNQINYKTKLYQIVFKAFKEISTP